MSMNDLLSDVLTRIRNGQRTMLYEVACPHSNVVQSVVEVLKTEGYVQGYESVDLGKGKRQISVKLKYADGLPVIRELKRISKPGRRVYHSAETLPRIQNGLGMSIISTSKGVMSDYEARKAGVGGEVLCSVF